jgi:hypothetical protein
MREVKLHKLYYSREEIIKVLGLNKDKVAIILYDPIEKELEVTLNYGSENKS